MHKIHTKNSGELIIYTGKKGGVELRTDSSKETNWATQSQIAEIFETTPQNITTHLKNIYKEKELAKNSTCKESLQVQYEGKRQIKRQIEN